MMPGTAPPKPSILDRLAARLFPLGNYSGLLQPDQEQGLQRQGLLNVGLNLLQAGGSQPMQRGTLGNIGASIQGVNFPEMAQQALQMQAYRSQQQEQAAISDVAKHHPIRPGMTRDEIYNNQLEMLNELMTIPGGAAIAEKWAPAIQATKPPTPDRARWSFQTIMENGEPQLYRVNEDTGVKYRIGMGKPAAGLGGVASQEARAAAQNALAALDDADAALRADPNADIQPTAAAVARGAGSMPIIGGMLRGAMEPIAQSQMTEPQKQFQQAMDQFLHNYASILPRGGRSIAILQNLRDSFAPKPGQTSAEVRASFAQARLSLRHSLEALARGEAPTIPLPGTHTPPGVAPVVKPAPAPGPPAAPGYNPKFWHP